MAGLGDDDEARKILSQLQDEQTQAGLDHIAECAREFNDAFVKAGFRRKEAFKLTRDILAGWLDRGIDPDEGEEEAEE